MKSEINYASDIFTTCLFIHKSTIAKSIREQNVTAFWTLSKMTCQSFKHIKYFKVIVKTLRLNRQIEIKRLNFREDDIHFTLFCTCM